MIAFCLLANLLGSSDLLVQEKPFAAEIEAIKKADKANPPAKGQILFIGSSSFTRWSDLSTRFPRYKVLNRAFGGSSLPDLLQNLDTILFPYNPCQVMIYCGENDFAGNESLQYDIVVDRFKALFSTVRKRFPGLPIAYVSMKPSPSRWHLAHKFIAANAAIKEFLSHNRHTNFIDVWPAMIGFDGMPIPEIFVEDRLHINNKGYDLWVPLIDKVLEPKGLKSKSLSLIPKSIQ